MKKLISILLLCILSSCTLRSGYIKNISKRSGIGNPTSNSQEISQYYYHIYDSMLQIASIEATKQGQNDAISDSLDIGYDMRSYLYDISNNQEIINDTVRQGPKIRTWISNLLDAHIFSMFYDSDTLTKLRYTAKQKAKNNAERDINKVVSRNQLNSKILSNSYISEGSVLIDFKQLSQIIVLENDFGEGTMAALNIIHESYIWATLNELKANPIDKVIGMHAYYYLRDSLSLHRSYLSEMERRFALYSSNKKISHNREYLKIQAFKQVVSENICNLMEFIIIYYHGASEANSIEEIEHYGSFCTTILQKFNSKVMIYVDAETNHAKISNQIRSGNINQNIKSSLSDYKTGKEFIELKERKIKQELSVDGNIEYVLIEFAPIILVTKQIDTEGIVIEYRDRSNIVHIKVPKRLIVSEQIDSGSKTKLRYTKNLKVVGKVRYEREAITFWEKIKSLFKSDKRLLDVSYYGKSFHERKLKDLDFKSELKKFKLSRKEKKFLKLLIHNNIRPYFYGSDFKIKITFI
jgi:hypothetical protein